MNDPQPQHIEHRDWMVALQHVGGDLTLSPSAPPAENPADRADRRAAMGWLKEQGLIK